MSELGVIFCNWIPYKLSSIDILFNNTRSSLSCPDVWNNLQRLWKVYVIADCESQVFHWHEPADFGHVLGQSICSEIFFILPCDGDYRLQLLQEKW